MRPVVALAVSTRGRRRSLRGHARRARARASSSSPPERSHLFRTSAVAQPALHRQLGDAQVLRGDALRRRRRRRARRRRARPRAGSAAPCSTRRDSATLACAAQAGGVDHDQRPPVDLERQVDRVAGRAGDVGDDHALGAEEAVDQRGLADVGAADHGQADGALVLAPATSSASGSAVDDAVEQVAGAEALRGRDGHRVAEAERVELGRQREVADGVDLVGRDDDGQSGAPQQVGHLLVAGPQPGLRVDDEHDRPAASASAARAWSRIEPASSSRSARSTPPVSISVKLAPVPLGRRSPCGRG